MQRRGFMSTLAASAFGLTLPRLSLACGGHVGNAEEEFLDSVDTSGKRRLLATHAVDARFPTTSRQRFAISANGEHLAYADLKAKSFIVLDNRGGSHAFAAPEGAEPIFNPTNPRTLLLLVRKVGRKQLLVIDLQTYESRVWNEFLDVRSVTFTPIGLVVAHNRPNHGGGAISLVKEPGTSEELRRLNFVHTLTQSRGAELGYFAAAEAYSMDLDGMKSTSFGTVPYELRAAAWLGEGLLGITDEGAYLMQKGQKYQRRLDDRSLYAVFNHGKYTVAASPNGLYVFRQDGRLFWHHPADGKLHDVRPLPGGNELVLCHGADVFVASIGARSTQQVAVGRRGTKLRGATKFGSRIVTWGSKSWHKTTEGRCVEEAIPPDYAD